MNFKQFCSKSLWSELLFLCSTHWKLFSSSGTKPGPMTENLEKVPMKETKPSGHSEAEGEQVRWQLCLSLPTPDVWKQSVCDFSIVSIYYENFHTSQVEGILQYLYTLHPDPTISFLSYFTSLIFNLCIIVQHIEASYCIFPVLHIRIISNFQKASPVPEFLRAGRTAELEYWCQRLLKVGEGPWNTNEA